MRLVSETSVMPSGGVMNTFRPEDKYYLFNDTIYVLSKLTPKVVQSFNFNERTISNREYTHPILDVFKTPNDETMLVTMNDYNYISFLYPNGIKLRGFSLDEDGDVLDIVVTNFIETDDELRIEFFALLEGDGDHLIMYGTFSDADSVKLHSSISKISNLVFNPIYIEASRYPNMIYIHDLVDGKMMEKILIFEEQNSIKMFYEQQYIDIVFPRIDHPNTPLVVTTDYPFKFLKHNENFLTVKLQSDHLTGQLIGPGGGGILFDMALTADYRDFKITPTHAMLISDDIIKVVFIEFNSVELNVFKTVEAQNRQINVLEPSQHTDKYIEQFKLTPDPRAWYVATLPELIRIMIVQQPSLVQKDKKYSILLNDGEVPTQQKEISIILGVDMEQLTFIDKPRSRIKRNEVLLKPYE